MNEKLNMALDWIKLNAGKCAANTELEDAKAAIELTGNRIDKALTVGEFLKLDSRIRDKLIEARGRLKEVSNGLSTIENICKDVTAIVNIRSAVRTLSDENIIYRNPEKAARAFGQIFVGLGRFCRFMEPLKPFGEFFEKMGEFFVDLRGGIVPELKPSHKRVNDEMIRGGDRPIW